MTHEGYVLEKLRKFKKEDIVITEHAQKQAIFRQVNLDDVKDNLINPERLVLAVKEEAKYPNEEKFDCLFDYGKNHAHRYIITTDGKLVVVTIININRRWQHLVDKYAKV